MKPMPRINFVADDAEITDEVRSTVKQRIANWIEQNAKPWTVGVDVFLGEFRSYDGTAYECRQPHVTQADWTPPQTPALWNVILPPDAPNVWTAGIAVERGEEYWYPDTDGTLYRVIQSHTTQTGWEPPNVPALWGVV